MSFGFSPSDVVLLGTTVASLISRIRSAPARYQEFTNDLLLANTIFSDLNSRLNTDLAGLAVARVHIHSSTIQTTFLGIRNSLDELQRRLDDHDNVGTTVRSSFANVKFSRKLDDLRRRLQFHMSSLQLVVQNLSLLQGQRIEEAIQLIRQAQEEQENEDVEEGWNESLDGFANCYLSHLETARLGCHSTHKSSTSASATSRDALIDRWLRGIQTAQSTSEAAPGMRESSENLIGITRSGESSMAASVPSMAPWRTPAIVPPDISIVAEERKSTIVPAVELTSEPAIAPKVKPKPESMIVQAVEVSQKRKLNEKDHRRLLTNTLGVFVIFILPMFWAFPLAWILGLVALATHFWAVNKTPTNGTSFQLDYSFANHPRCVDGQIARKVEILADFPRRCGFFGVLFHNWVVDIFSVSTDCPWSRSSLILFCCLSSVTKCERIQSSASYPLTLANSFPSYSCGYRTRCKKYPSFLYSTPNYTLLILCRPLLFTM